MDLNAPEFLVEATVWLGDWVRDPQPGKSMEEAIIAADQWIGHADTVGGDARVVHIPTGKIVWDSRCYPLYDVVNGKKVLRIKLLP